MSQIADASYIGKGEIFIGPYDGLSKMRSVGNCSGLTFSHGTEKKELLDYTSAGGGKANALSRVTGVTMSMNLRDVSAENLALGAFGTTSAVTAVLVTDEVAVGYKSGLVALANLPNTALTITVKNTAGTTTYVAGTDYILNGAGIYVLPGSTIPDAVAGAANLKITYTKLASNVVQALVTAAGNYKLTFVGLNEAQSGRAAVITVHKFLPGAAQNVSWIGDDYVDMQLDGEAVSDAAIVGAGLSKFYIAKLA